ncbi:hypothetical protein B5M09_008272 [Aphanomyces astaci]|uniref:ABC transporter domain-containing protein n=1 Tax=Aphanomyces astaci TaxID=112090 RepID=A0A3R7X8N0_APHAT|nr:hypothetical protein B5M09_008272 [Aphanomyces astaci]
MGETLRQQETPGEGQQIRNLRKVCFSGKVAVHGVQITCFLGHNDAGKTPLMSMLTRMILATVGMPKSMASGGLDTHVDTKIAKVGLSEKRPVVFSALSEE